MRPSRLSTTDPVMVDKAFADGESDARREASGYSSASWRTLTIYAAVVLGTTAVVVFLVLFLFERILPR